MNAADKTRILSLLCSHSEHNRKNTRRPVITPPPILAIASPICGGDVITGPTTRTCLTPGVKQVHVVGRIISIVPHSGTIRNDAPWSLGRRI
jgi:hypothetical protein